MVANFNMHYKDNRNSPAYFKKRHTMIINKSPAFELALFTALALYHGSDSLEENTLISENVTFLNILFDLNFLL